MFSEILNDLLQRTNGSLAAFIVGMDGLIVEYQSSKGSGNYESLAAESAALLTAATATAAALPASPVRELSLVVGEYRLLLRMITHSYFAMLLTDESAALGQARFELRKKHPDLEKELAF